MKEGKEPMRTFGDLIQFYQEKPAVTKEEPSPTDQKPPAVNHEASATNQEPPADQEPSTPKEE